MQQTARPYNITSLCLHSNLNILFPVNLISKVFTCARTSSTKIFTEEFTCVTTYFGPSRVIRTIFLSTFLKGLGYKMFGTVNTYVGGILI